MTKKLIRRLIEFWEDASSVFVKDNYPKDDYPNYKILVNNEYLDELPKYIKKYDDSLVAKAAEEYPSPWQFEKQEGLKYAYKKDADDNLFFKVLEVERESHLGSYVDSGVVYLAEKHENGMPGLDFTIWEIPPEIMKRSSSQFLIYYWDDDAGWSVELDF